MRGVSLRRRKSAARTGAGVALCCAFCLVLVGACGDASAPSPFAPDAGAGGEGGAPNDAGTQPDSGADDTLGGPCLDSEQCDDGIECTADACDLELGRCRFSPVRERCQDDIYCNGSELCLPGLGCRSGEPVACSDATPCTIDTCVERTQTCERRPRDADGDGDPVWNCGGGDCDDTNPRVGAEFPEICGNDVDDDCDGQRDESGCETPLYDTCSDPLLLQPGTFQTVSLAFASEDFGLSCAESEDTRRDVVAALVVPEGPPQDVDIVATSSDGVVTVAVADGCTRARTELSCVEGLSRGENEGSVARTIVRSLPPGTYPVFVSGTGPDDVTLAVSFGTVLPPSENETCDTAVALTPGENVSVTLAGAARDLESVCQEAGSDLVFRFTLDAAADVELRALSPDDYGEPFVSLRDAGCRMLASELGCRLGNPAALFVRGLPAGSYYAVVGSSGASDIDVRLDVSEATEAPRGEGCLDPAALVPGRTHEADLARRVDAVTSPCAIGAPEETLSLTLEERSDVLLVERLSTGDRGAVSLLRADCRPAMGAECSSGSQSPLRSRLQGIEPGEYRVVAESRVGSPITVTAFTRPARPPTLVPLSDGCETATEIPETGGRFVGSTANAYPEYEASCDFGGSVIGGARDQILQLELTERRRVVLDMGESGYDTLLAVRRGDECPGTEVLNGCAPGYVTQRSYLDLVLSAGTYWVQVDGYNGAFGPWVLDVFTAAP